MSTIKPFLILQLRPEDAASDNELSAILKSGGLKPGQFRRIRLEQTGLPDVNLNDFSGVIVGGGPFNASDPEDIKSDTQKQFEKQLAGMLSQIIVEDFPYFGACYGLGMLAKQLGGTVAKGKYVESAEALTIYWTDAATDDPITQGLPPQFRAFAGHKESVLGLPPGAVLLAHSEVCPVHMIHFKQNIYASQFHPELDASGMKVRINIYRNAGYFPPGDAQKLIDAAAQEKVAVPGMILRRFVERYRQVTN